MDPTTGQRALGALVDLAFFLVLGFLGWQKVLGEPTLATLLSSYAAGRFGVAMGKQQAQMAYMVSGSGGPPSAGGGGTSSSGTMRSVRPPAEVTPAESPQAKRVDPRTMRTTSSPLLAALFAMWPTAPGGGGGVP